MAEDLVQTSEGSPPEDAELERIVGEESKVLARVLRTLELRMHERLVVQSTRDYDAELIALRDQINEARLEDVPPLIEEMERLQGVAARRAQVTEGAVDPKSPYFGRLVLEENARRREVLIGKSTYLDPKTGVRIVDWRDAPVSRIYYRYDEGDDYEENFGGRDVEGEVVTRRSLSISRSLLQRIGTPQGTFVRGHGDTWRRLDADSARLHGGQGSAVRPEHHHRPGRLGSGVEGREDKHLPEIAALIDPAQFDLITRPSSGLVVIQGGAGSGKTTIGLHRMAYLAFQEPKRFTSDKMLCIVFNDALARYISRVLPALGVPGVLVTTYERWAHRLRVQHVQGLPKEYTEDTPVVVTRLKKHPALLRMMERRVSVLAERVDREVNEALASIGSPPEAMQVWRDSSKHRPGVRMHRLSKWLKDNKKGGALLPMAAKHTLERVVEQLGTDARDVVGIWSELLTDRDALRAGFEELAPGAFTEQELQEAYRWCVERTARVVAYRDIELSGGPEDDEADAESNEGIDGVDEREVVMLDVEDDTLFLRLVQLLRGGLTRRGDVLSYDHIFVDEAQDLSPVEMSVVLDTATRSESITLAGDVAQRLHMHNGFTDWRTVLADLGLSHVSVEPLKLTYRSTFEIIEFANGVLGPLRNEEEGRAVRHGAPVESFRFAHTGDAVGFLGEALRELLASEPMASVAVIARYPEQADLYYRGFVNAEVPNLRRIAEQDFPFKPGVDVTDVRQVKGLEFDYVILVECSRASYSEDNESRHLLHIAATRAAHQLWVTSSGDPSLILPDDIRASLA
ncbi:MAG: ATP-binding domain-containing protein [Myxococcales bacterium]|nr:ATP-binding domain-containing protein [Myxococcales bacterium]